MRQSKGGAPAGQEGRSQPRSLHRKKPMKPQGLALAFLLVTAAPAAAISVKDFNAQTRDQQAATVAGCIEKMAADLSTKNAVLAQIIRDYFSPARPGMPLTEGEGLDRLYIELAGLETKSHDGKADLSKTQLEDVIARIVKLYLPATNEPISVKDFDALPPYTQTIYLRGLIHKMVIDLWDKNRQLAQNMREYFYKSALHSKANTSEGEEKLHADIAAIEDQAKQGKADLSQIQLESVILQLVKQKFPPPTSVP